MADSNGSNPEAGTQAMQEAIALRARELYQLRGCAEGHALEDWLLAEAELKTKVGSQAKPSDESHPAAKRDVPASAPVAPRAAFFNIKVDGVLYTVKYDPDRCDFYRPGMLKKGQPVELRFERDKIYLKLPNSKELEAKVVRKGQV
jgi:hypothetical protein